MSEALRGHFDITVYCRAPYPNLKTRTPPKRHIADRLWRLPFVGRLRNWRAWHNNYDFDRAVVNQLSPTQVFHGAVGQCLNSLRTAKRLGARTILDCVTLHVDDFKTAQAECRRFGVRPPMHRWEQDRILQEYQEADLIRVMSNVALRTFLKRGFAEDKLVVASPPFPLQEFPQASHQESVFRVCYVGLVEPWKGFHHLVEAFDQLQLPDAELTIWGGCGARPISQYMQAKMAKNPNIKLYPEEIRKRGLAEVYGKSSVLVLPSLADGFGYVVGEAMACGIPAIVSSMTGAADLIKDGVNGYVIPPSDINAIASRLEHLAKHPALVKSMGLAARETMRQRSSSAFAEAYAERILNLLDQ